MPKVVVGLSGGVDSAVTAYLLKTAGYEVIGMTLKTWIASDGKDSRCCEIDDAAHVAEKLGIPYFVTNCVSEFRNKVIDPFINDYLHGLTPNPCTVCNRQVKWEGMLSAAGTMGADYIATGHYASVVRLPNGRYTVAKALHAEKDQTYMLYRLSQEQLQATLMPLGKLTKKEVRRIAEEAGLPVASKPDSQEICFVPDDDYAGFIEENAGTAVPGEGHFVDENGKCLGTHKGIIHYTVGQRKGLGLAMGYPAYVRKIDAGTNEVVIGKEDSLYSRNVICRNLNFMGIPPMEEGERLRCFAKIRYHHPVKSAEIEMTGPDEVKILFDEPVRAAAPGQSAVFYDEEDRVIGGGTIAGAF